VATGLPEGALKTAFACFAARDFKKALAAFETIDAAITDEDSNNSLTAAALGMVSRHAFKAASELGNHARALHFANRELMFVEKASGTSYARARALNNRGLAGLELGRLVEAEFDLLAARAALAAAQTESLLADPNELRRIIEDHLGILRSLQGSRERPAVSQPQPLPERIRPRLFLSGPDDDVDVVNTAFNAARVAALEGDELSATDIWLQCIATLSANGSSKALGIAYSNLGSALVAERAYERAVEAFHESVARLRTGPRPSEPLAVALHGLSQAQQWAGARTAAAASTKSAWLEIDEAAPDTPRALQILHQLAQNRLYERDFGRARGALEHAGKIYDSNRAHFAATEEGHAGTFATFRAHTELMLLLAVHEQFPDEALEWLERAKARFFAERSHAHDDGHQERSSGDRSAVVLANLPGEPGQLMLSYFAGSNFSFVVKVMNGLVGCARIDLSDAGLCDLIDEFREELRASPTNSADGAGAKLSEHLFRAGFDWDADDIIIAPDGNLWRVPFDALPVPDGPGRNRRGMSLGDLAPVSFVPTFSSLRELRKRGSPTPGKEQVLIVTRSAFAGLPPLVGAAEEAERVRQRGQPRQTVMLQNEAATPESVVAALPAAHIIHFATHATAGRAQWPSAVVLAGPGGADTFLSSEDIEGLRLQPALVFLSCCESAVGRASIGEGLVSVARAFLLAGARCVIASLWRVEDRLTEAFVAFFYDHLFAGETPARSLHSAKLRARAEGWPASSISAFQVIGDGGRDRSMAELLATLSNPP
jgi:tetratricopeptide (TPR) repeat protein